VQAYYAGRLEDALSAFKKALGYSGLVFVKGDPL
jgi:hypothetical protein